MRISDLMTRNVRCCHPHEALSAAAKVMWDSDCGCVPVVAEDRRVVGMITDRDICMATFTQDRRPSEIRIGDVMTPDPQCCTPENRLEDAEELMRLHQIRRLPVVDQQGRLVGILSLNDLALEYDREKERPRKEVDAEEISSALSAICAHSH